MNNLMPIDLNFKKNNMGKFTKKDNISDKLDFRKKLDSYSKKNDIKDVRKNTKKQKEKTITETRDIKKHDKEVEKHNKEVEKHDKEFEKYDKEVEKYDKEVEKYDKEVEKQNEDINVETNNINESEVVESKDIQADEIITKEDLEAIMSILQSINVEFNNEKQVEDIQKNIGEFIQKMENGEVNTEELKNLFIKLEEAEFIPKEVKTEILNKLELMINQKNIKSNYLEIDNTNTEKNTIENSKVKENSKVEMIKESEAEQDYSQSKISNVAQTNENLQQNTSYNQNKDLDSINKNFLINDTQDETQEDFNFQNLNVSKATNTIKGITGNLNNNKMSNIDSYNIIEQITKKSNMIINKDNSTIQMQLEPEHLGKLTLKVVLERGIISAKFMAENEEVKTAIEENIEELKNSLSEQGITIQSLSVSVDSQGDLNKHKNILEAMAYNKKISKNIGTNESLLDEDQNEIENPYLFEDDNFNGLV